MQIEIVNVVENTKTNKAGKSYTELEVIYKNDEGKAQTKKIMSFSNPSVYKAVKATNAGDKLEVTTQKDDNGYWQWTGVGGEVKTVSGASSTPTATKVVGSTYETKEERAVKQKYIVRQSSLTTAIEIMKVGAKNLDKYEVIALAEELESWVFRNDTVKLGSIDEMDSDVPY